MLEGILHKMPLRCLGASRFVISMHPRKLPCLLFQSVKFDIGGASERCGVAQHPATRPCGAH